MPRQFESDAVLVIDGTERAVYARISIFGDETQVKEWFGSLTADEPGLEWELQNARVAILCMPDGKEGSVRTSDGPSRKRGDVAFTGSGHPPV
ncbi:hypothetical protein OHA37_01140 [Streptomyces sp. NBC_00335]|uniref:hypothetical protein n=1 Tax=unclassified Streptomyces TaxID=2593676 RepID=UPI0022521B02|nr:MULTISPECIES: hypothetical protein [unclassified Streptomyces]MCX5402490.1 hypothetical protein [Streptomyces sp. NBC_00086]